jgi:protein O-mannosyl-transferase
MMQGGRHLKLIAFVALLLVVDSFLYFRHAAHFFSGDSVLLLSFRGVSVSDYLKEFIQLNPSLWYRPLANELIESILFPIAGLHPIPYRIPVYAIFLAITVAVYALVLALSRRHLAAAIAAFFFSIQTANAYTTYDVGFMPELLYAFFYVASTLAYLRYVETENRAAFGISLACFVFALLSKEAAVTLPVTLFVMHVIFYPGHRRSPRRLIYAVRATAPHMLILIVYLVFALGYLNVRGFTVTKLMNQSQPSSDYFPVFGSGMLKTADVSLSWVFNIPRAYTAQLEPLNPFMLGYLKFFRGVVLLLIAVVLIRSERKSILFGLAWFWITLFPALPLIMHFLPYYVFLPAVGLSLIVGIVFAWLYDALSRIHTSIAAAIIVLTFSGLFYVTSNRIDTAIEHDGILGGSAKPAWNTLNDLRNFYPRLPEGATLYFVDGNEYLSWYHAYGGLIKMAYGTDKISVLYESQGDQFSPKTQNVFVFGVRNGRLIDETIHYRTNPQDFARFINSSSSYRPIR